MVVLLRDRSFSVEMSPIPVHQQISRAGLPALDTSPPGPTKTIPRLFKLLAANYWAPSLANIGLFPLRYRNQQCEAAYVDILNASMRPAIRLISYLSQSQPLQSPSQSSHTLTHTYIHTCTHIYTHPHMLLYFVSLTAGAFNLGCLGLVLAYTRLSGLEELQVHSHRWTLPCLSLLMLVSVFLGWASHTIASGNFYERSAITAFLLVDQHTTHQPQDAYTLYHLGFLVHHQATLLICIWLGGIGQLKLLHRPPVEELLILHYRYLVAGSSFGNLVMYLMIIFVALRVRSVPPHTHTHTRCGCGPLHLCVASSGLNWQLQLV